MGTPKALLTFSNGVTFIEQIAEKYLEAGTERIVLVINPSLSQKINSMPFCQNHHVIVVENKEPEKGRIHSIKLGLNKMAVQPIFIQNVDNPFVTVELLNQMIPLLQPNKYVSPFYKGSGGHPILISKEIALQLKGCDLKTPLNLFLANCEQLKMEQGNSGILVNINTPDDYRSAFK
jgi:molybdenum cofactor cytidylyltransferase